MKLFVTGGTGFLGSAFLECALATGCTVTALRRPGSKPRRNLADGVRWVEGDLSGDVSAGLRGCDALVHLAAVGVSPQVASWEDLFTYNVLHSLRLWRTAIAVGVKKHLICGSCFEYGASAARFDSIPADAPLEPVTAYGASKAAASVAAHALAKEASCTTTIYRPFTVYGEGQHPDNFLPSLMRAAAQGADFPMTPGEQLRDFQEVGDCARQILQAVEALQARSLSVAFVNGGSGVTRTLRSFAEEQWHAAGAKGKLLFGAVPYRKNEVMRFVPRLTPAIST